MTKHPAVDLHVRVPPITKQRAEEMAAEDAAPRKGTLTDWIVDLIEAEYARRPKRGEHWRFHGNEVIVHHLGRRPCGLVVFWGADEANCIPVDALIRDGVRVVPVPIEPAKKGKAK